MPESTERETAELIPSWNRAAITQAGLINLLRENKRLTAELTAAKQCDLCAQSAEYRVCQQHLDDLRGPDVHNEAEGDLPEPGRMVLWGEPGGETFIGGFDLSGWFAQGGEADDRIAGPMLWCYLPGLDYLYRFQRETKKDGAK